MNNPSDFIIENGVLKKYVGSGGDVAVPEGVTAIGIGAFATRTNQDGFDYWEEDTRIQSVSFPETLEEIRSHAFYKNTALERIAFSSGLRIIGYDAFSDCHALSEIHIPEGVEWVETNAFSGCKGLRRISVPGSIKTFSASPYNPYAYEKLDSLEEISIETNTQDEEHIAFLASRLFSLESLADYYLNGKIKACDRLNKAFFKRLNTKANRSRFFGEFLRSGNVAMTTKFLEMIPRMSAEELDEYIKNAEQSPEIRTLFVNYKDRLFSAADLAAMAASQEEKELGLRERTLADWKKIYTINKLGSITGYKDTSPTAEIPARVKNTFFNVGANAFKNCTYLEFVTIAEGVTIIDNSAFNGCVNLAHIKIPSTLEIIGASAFKNCAALEDVHFPGGITNIGSKAFEGCDALVIHAPAGSKILQYAKKNNIPFVAE